MVRTKLRQAREEGEQKDDEKQPEPDLASTEAVTLTAEELPDETAEAYPNKKRADLQKFGWARMLPMRIGPAPYDKRVLVLQAREAGIWKEIVPFGGRYWTRKVRHRYQEIPRTTLYKRRPCQSPAVHYTDSYVDRPLYKLRRMCPTSAGAQADQWKERGIWRLT